LLLEWVWVVNIAKRPNIQKDQEIWMAAGQLRRNIEVLWDYAVALMKPELLKPGFRRPQEPVQKEMPKNQKAYPLQ
jgi:hypothetical protein